MLRQIGQQLFESLAQPEKPVEKEWRFVVDPSPTYKILNVELHHSTDERFAIAFEIYNEEGRIEVGRMMGVGSHEIEVSGLRPGIYVAKAWGPVGDPMVYRFIKH